MDEIMTHNFMLLDEVVADGRYDLVIGDETWELDYHLHENPNLKKTSYVWMTDFVGWVPMPSGGEREAFVAADYNAEMIEHIARYPRVRDKAIFVGNPEDIISGPSGPISQPSETGPLLTTTSPDTSPVLTRTSSAIETNFEPSWAINPMNGSASSLLVGRVLVEVSSIESWRVTRPAEGRFRT